MASNKIGQGGHFWNIPELMAKMPENIKLKCSVDGCNNRRNRISRWCINHVLAHSLFGDPLAKTVGLKTLQPYIEQVTSLLELNPEHPGIELTRQFFKARYDGHVAGAEFKYSWHYFKIYETLTIEEIIARVAGIYLLRELDEANRWFPTERAVHHAIYYVLTTKLGKAPETGRNRLQRSQYKWFGAQVAKELGIFFLALAKAVGRRKLAKYNRVQALAAPWMLDVKPPLASQPPEPQKPQKAKAKKPKKRKPKRKPKPGDPKFRWPLHPVTGKKTTMVALCREYDVPLDRTKWRVDHGGWKLMDALTLPKGANKPSD